jgi:hypothetical protein
VSGVLFKEVRYALRESAEPQGRTDSGGANGWLDPARGRHPSRRGWVPEPAGVAFSAGKK